MYLRLGIECHAGQKTGVYCIFDTFSESFEPEIIGNRMTWLKMIIFMTYLFLIEKSPDSYSDSFFDRMCLESNT